MVVKRFKVLVTSKSFGKGTDIVLTPHLAASSFEVADAIDMINARTIVSVLAANEPPYSVINRDEINEND